MSCKDKYVIKCTLRRRKERTKEVKERKKLNYKLNDFPLNFK
jgi:hypothetical protein